MRNKVLLSTISLSVVLSLSYFYLRPSATRTIAAVQDCADCNTNQTQNYLPTWVTAFTKKPKVTGTLFPDVKDLSLKSDEEIDYYIDCFKNTTSSFKMENYNNYKPLLKRASEITGVPYVALVCFYYKESKFNKSARSGVGAQGIAMFMPSTRKELQNKFLTPKPKLYFEMHYIDKLKTRYASNEKMTELLNELDASMRDPETKKSRVLSSEEDLLKVHKILTKAMRLSSADPLSFWDARATVEYKKSFMQRMWKEYFEPLPTKPKTFTDAYNAEQAIIAGALYIKMIETDYEPIDGWDSVSNLEHYVFTAGAYNIGPGNLFNRCSFTKDTVESCIKKTSNTENRKHMQYLKNCMSRGNLGTTHSGGTTKCEPYKEPREAETALDPIVLKKADVLPYTYKEAVKPPKAEVQHFDSTSVEEQKSKKKRRFLWFWKR